jgi:hypothetical protein
MTPALAAPAPFALQGGYNEGGYGGYGGGAPGGFAGGAAPYGGYGGAGGGGYGAPPGGYAGRDEDAYARQGYPVGGPNGWVAYRTQDTGEVYFHNHTTNTTTWERPPEWLGPV